MRALKLTPESEAILRREAMLRAQSKTLKQLAHQTGLSETYVQNVIARLVRECSTLPAGPLEPEKNQ